MFSKNMVVFTAVSGLAVQALHDSAVTHCSCTFACGTSVARQCRHTLQLHICLRYKHCTTVPSHTAAAHLLAVQELHDSAVTHCSCTFLWKSLIFIVLKYSHRFLVDI
jgi:hypothetical protein